jgi:hypothetical protein
VSDSVLKCQVLTGLLWEPVADEFVELIVGAIQGSSKGKGGTPSRASAHGTELCSAALSGIDSGG